MSQNPPNLSESPYRVRRDTSNVRVAFDGSPAQKYKNLHEAIMKQLSTINDNLSRIPQYQSMSSNSVAGSQNIEPRNSSLSPKDRVLKLDNIFKRDPSYEERKSDIGLNQSGILNPLTLSNPNLNV